MKKLFLYGIFAFVSVAATAQTVSPFEKHVFVHDGDTLPYRLLLPLNYDSAKSYPLVLFLHGAGERGNDNEKQLSHGSSLFLRDSIRRDYPAIVVFPQCPVNSFWANISRKNDTARKTTSFGFDASQQPTAAMGLLLKLYEHLKSAYNVNPEKVYVGGLSMGGMGTFEIANRLPHTFAAAFAICGGGDTTTAKNMTDTGWWIFHGLKDDIVNPQLSRNMATALKRAGAEVKLTLYPDDNHNSWDSTFGEPDLIPWLFGHTLKTDLN